MQEKQPTGPATGRGTGTNGHTPIIPEVMHMADDAYAAEHWDYQRRCADLDLALAATRERIEEWDHDADPHGWWHERPQLIALYNAIVERTAS